MTDRTINIARDFSRFPAGRYKADGPYPGEYCRKKLLVPALKNPGVIVIELDGTRGYGSSFLEEAFGGLIRAEGFKESELKQRLTFKSSDPTLADEIWGYVSDAEAEAERTSDK